MSLKSVKTEPQDRLYEGHEVKNELVLGPIVLQERDLTYQLNDKNKLPTEVTQALGIDEMVRLVPENLGRGKGLKSAHTSAEMSPKPACVKQEPADDELLLVADLGTNEMVRLGLTPETMGADYEIYQNKLEADVKKEPSQTPSFEKELQRTDDCVLPASPVDGVAKELLKDEGVSDCKNGVHRRSRRINNKQKAETKTEYTKFSNNLTFETDSEDGDTGSEYEVKDSTHEESDSKQTDSESNKKLSKSIKQKKVKKPKKRHICDYCRKEFSFRAGLTNHIRTHTGEKPYSCNICSKKFSDCAVLVRHRRMHSGDKPHACDICGKKYGEKYLLKNHKLVHTGEMQYFCKYCPKQFVNSSNYRRHQLVHMHKFVCDMCTKPFATKDRLVSHIVNHMKPKPFTCKYCKKGFGQSGHLNRHLLTHTGAKEMYTCGNCKHKFTQKVSLKKHIDRNVCKKKGLKK